MSSTATELAPQWSTDKYSFKRALRPFSLVVALISCGLGLLLGWAFHPEPFWPALVAMMASLLLQAGVNLINDYGDREQLDSRFPQVTHDEKTRLAQTIQYNYYIGLVCIVVGALLGIGLVMVSGPWLVWIGLCGVLGALGYAQDPLDLKGRGLGLVAVFWLTGILMVEGAYYVMAGHLSLHVLWLSLPISCLMSLLLLSNELRDSEYDAIEGQKTLTVRIGRPRAITLYKALSLLPFVIMLLLWALGEAPYGWLTCLALFLIPNLWGYLTLPAGQRQGLPPRTGRLMASFGLLQMGSVVLSTWTI
ncbi:hypothetical protein BFW38_09185 [Terasakiispira papahanaumokuakeensis]|uniref:1,4-dihydroxy-2-naphthoate octaprenyltransferase n=1 Tax=Terasakiispira papahanaumokuakeensis TaxID=197479 RepID=A0A1E2V9J9_9GAMM|nr:prenyltransferase [Terasakiispira papahanaumokuakeensis]ODC03690.1 hypothetical protein BFW38_09185 [Terasakiispira papahanaumokuakeensis]